MNVTCERTCFARALSAAGQSGSTHRSMAILKHVLLETLEGQLRVTSTDLDTASRCVIPANVTEPGAIALPAAPLSEFVSALPDGPVTLEVVEGRATLRSGLSSLRLPSAPAEDFPVIPEVPEGTDITLPQATLKDMLHMVTFAVPRNDKSSMPAGALFEVTGAGLALVATDELRLALKRAVLPTPAEQPVSAIVPLRPLTELEQLLTKDEGEMVTIRFGGKFVRFTLTDVTVTSSLIEAKFPNYNRVIPKASEHRVTFERGQLFNAVRRIDVVSRKNNHKLVLQTAGGTTHMAANSVESGQAEEEVSVALDGADLTAAFNCRYLMEALGVISTESVSLEMNGPLQPCVLRAGEDFLCVVMPMAA